MATGDLYEDWTQERTVIRKENCKIVTLDYGQGYHFSVLCL